MKSYPHLATRLFNTPLLIARPKLDAILAAVGPRLGVDVAVIADGPKSYGPGDQGAKRKDYYVTEDGIAIISIFGPLVKRDSGEFLSGGPTTYGQIENEFLDAATDPNIKGILLQIDSPGGESVGAFELSDLIYSQRGSKPIIAAVDGDAFSAAFALASAADQVIVTKSGGVGSVGVWMLHADWSKAEEDAGVKVTYIFFGARKIDGNPDNPLSEEAFQVFQTEVNRIGDMFVNTVARNRSMKAASVKGTEAGLFFGPNGVDIGFADKVGTVADAMAEMRRRISTKSSSVANMSATRGGNKTMNAEEVADTQKPPEPEAAAPASEAQESLKVTVLAMTEEELNAKLAAAKAEGFAHAKTLIEWCGLAGLPIKKAVVFLKPEATADSMRKELMEARAANGGEEISGHIMPEAGATAKTKTEDSPLVKLAEARAAAQGGK